MTIITLPIFPSNARFFQSSPVNHWVITQPESMRWRGAMCWEVHPTKEEPLREFNTTEEQFCLEAGPGSPYRYIEYPRDTALEILRVYNSDHKLPEGF